MARRWVRRPGGLRAETARVLVHAVIVASAFVQVAVLPLLGLYGRDYHLGAAAVGVLLALPSLGMLLAALPAGVLADRYGVRGVTIAAAGLLTASSLLCAAGALAPLLVGRALFGVAYGALWTTCPAWLAQLCAPVGAGGQDGSAGSCRGGVGAIVTSSAAGSTVGPLLSGVLAQHAGVGAPFVLLGGVSAVLTVALALVPQARVAAAGAPRRPPWRLLPAVARERPGVVAAVVAMVVCGGVAGVTQLLVPLQLQRAGSSAVGTGALLSVAGGLYVVVSAATTRLGARLVTARATGWGCALVALALLPTAAGRGSGLLVASLLLFTVARAGVNTISYPLAAAGGAAASAGGAEPGYPGAGTVMGLLNVGWSVSMMAAPVLAGWLAQRSGVGVTYLATAAVAGGLAAVLLRQLGSPRPALAIAGSAR